MNDLSLLYELFVVLVSATIVVLVFHRLKLPHLVGFLFCGMVVGPHGMNLISRPENIDALAEIGVVLLLFTIGLEFSLTELRRIKRYVLLGGVLQLFATSGFAFAIIVLSGMQVSRALFLSQIFALSSTAIVLSVLASRGETDTSQGRIILGILLFQDLCVVPMMLMAPLLSGGTGFDIFGVALSFAKALLLIGLVLLLAVFIVPKVLEVIVHVRVREILVPGVVVICVGTAWLTSSLGLSLALGAFIAGLAISESPYGHQVFAEILPFKDLFNSLFFVSVGMLLDMRFLGEHLALLLLIVLGTLLAKTLLGGLVVKLLSGSTRLALLVGLSISQIGEFSFVLARFGLQFDLLNISLYQGFLAVTVLTMMATPFLMTAASYFAQRVPPRLDSQLIAQQQKASPRTLAGLREHTIIVGFGLNGRYLARVLKDSSIPYCILELNPRAVRDAQKDDEPIYFGDASRMEILRMVNLAEARILVIAVAEMPVVRRIVAVARQNRGDLYIIARTKFAAHAEELYQLGADQVIAEEFETATEIFARVLAEYDFPRNAIDTYVETIRREGASMLRKPGLLPPSLKRLQQLLAGNVVENFLLLENSPAVGMTLGQLDLRKKTGASVIAIMRDDRPTSIPSGESVLAAGDLLVLMGAYRQLENAKRLLSPSLRDA